MLQWLLSLPRKIFVILILGGAIIFIVLQNPPHTICRTQIDNFKSRQKGMIYKDPKIKTRTKPLMDILIANCKKFSSPGSCYGLFSRARVFIHEFRLISSDCYKSFSLLGKVKNTLRSLYSLMIRLAWGDAPATEYGNKFHWLSHIDISLFCSIKEQIFILYGQSTLLSWERKIFQKLPEAKKMTESRIRELSLVSENCALYPN